MSLLSVAQSEGGYILASNLDTASTEATVKSPGSIISTAYGTITAAGVSLTGNNSYTFGSNGYVIHGYSGLSGMGSGFGAGTLEIVFKRSSNPSGTVTLLRRQGQTIYEDGASLRLNSDGTVALFVSGGQTGTMLLTSTADVCDGNWHHVVGYYSAGDNNGGSTLSRLFVDGVQVATTNTSVGNGQWGFNVSVGASISNSGNISGYSEATIDFAAVYRGGLASPATFVANHLAEFANKVLAADPSTASALSVQPAISTEAILSADLMTASSDSGNHSVSNFNIVPTLENYLASLPLEQWYKFNQYKLLTNYGTGGTASANFLGNVEVPIDGGIQFSGALKFAGSANDGSVSITSGTISNVLNPEISDANWVTGFWWKSPSKNESGEPLLIIDNQGHGLRLIYSSNGVIDARWENSSGVHTIAYSGNRLDDDKWHFIVVKYENNVIEYFVDNTLIGTHSVNGSYPSISSLGFGTNYIGNRSVKFLLSHFFIGTTANITSQVLTNIYTYGSIVNQATAVMNNAFAKFNTAFNDKSESYSPIIGFPLNDPVGVNSTSDVIGGIGSVVVTGTNYSSGNLTKNNRGWTFTNRDTFLQGSFNTPAGTFSGQQTQTLAAIVKATTTLSGAPDFWAGMGTSNISGSGIGLSIRGVSGGSGLAQLFINGGAAGTASLVGNTYVYDGNYHLIVAVKNGTNIYLYVDGKLEASGTTNIQLTDAGNFGIGSVGLAANVTTGSAARNTTIDEMYVYSTALTSQQIFELWQSITLSMETTATTDFPMPTFTAGTGVINTANVMTASAEKIYPSHWGPTMIGFATFMMPNYYAEVIINDNYFAEPMEASTLFHDPQFSIGEINSVDHMNASAELPMPTVFTPGRFTANVMTGGDAVFVNPGIITIKGARYFAEPMRSNAILPLPPAYVQLSDDKWFATLLEGHADRITEPVQANLGNLPNQTTIDVIKGGFLSFFNEFNSDLTLTTQINSISSEIPAHYFDREDIIKYDSSGNILALDTSKNISPARAPRGTSITTPRMGVGYFDPYERKAVRVENIEFPFPGTSSDHSERPYNLEFSIKTTKKDQVLAYGIKTSYLYYSRSVGAIGLSDGKIYLAEDGGIKFSTTGFNRGLYPISAPHPKNFINRAQYLLSKTDIADGQWHHIIIQKGYGDENLRTQIWIDGKLDRQLFTVDADGRSFYSTTPGLDGTNNIRPYILGFNSNDPLLYSDFETSGWNFYPGRFITSQKTLINYSAYLKYEPIKAEPMTATLRIGQETIGQGNRARMLLLYWWRNPVGYNQFVNTVTNPLTTGYDGNNSPWSPEDLIDDPKKGPIYWEGWDVFPVGIVKPGASDVVKLNNVGSGGYLDIENGRMRLLDLQQDLDLTQFDTIMFANYPTTSAQLDEFIREEVVDTYFGIKEKDIYADFLKSLRAAVDSGMSLLVQFDQLARDLKIYDRVDRIPVFNEGISDKRAFWHTNNVSWDIANNRPNAYESNIFGNPGFNILDEDKCSLDIDLDNGAYFEDRYNNMRHRIINTVEFLTDDPTYIFTDRARYQHSDYLDFGGPDRVYERFEYKIQGLQPGDEFVFGNPSNQTTFGNTRALQNSILAIPFENVKAGRIITAQPEKYWKGNEYVDNPYKNYAHSIALLPGDVLDGKGVGGKIFVSISEVFWDETPEYRIVDLYSDYWIDISYDLGFFGTKKASANDPDGPAEIKRNELKGKQEYISPTGISAEQYAWSTYWSRNDKFAFTQIDRGQDYSGVLGILFESSIDLERVPTSRKALTSFSRRRDQLGRFASGAGGNGQLFFQIKSGRTTETMNIFVPNLFTRAFWWLSDRLRPTGLVQRPQAAAASATMPSATPVVDKIINVNAPAMIANAIIPANITGTSNPTTLSVSLTTLPLTANALMVTFGKTIKPDVFIATGLTADPGIFTYSLEEVILTIANTEAILYVRGDKIT